MSILDQIVADKKVEIERRKSLYPVKLLEESTFFGGQPVSLKSYIQRPDKVGVIAEFKRQSPSKGVINASAKVEKTTIGYMQAGASGLSILTDEKYFGGKNEDLITARSFNFCPILRKDFIIDEYQILEAKSIGADVILLIASCLTPEEIKKFGSFAHSLGIEVLLEVHNEEELNASICEYIDLLGVNNRDLATFETTIEISKTLAEKIPDDFVKVSESGLSDASSVIELMKYGYEGFLIGESFMRKGTPQKACANFIKQIQELSK